MGSDSATFSWTVSEHVHVLCLCTQKLASSNMKVLFTSVVGREACKKCVCVCVCVWGGGGGGGGGLPKNEELCELRSLHGLAPMFFQKAYRFV